MNLFKFSWSYLKAKPLSASLSLILVALGVSLSTLLLLINAQITERLYRNVEGINLVVGAKGSPLQMILAYVYHIDLPTGNIPLAESKIITKNPYIEQAIPLALGDSYRGFRIVGTDSNYLKHYQGRVTQGREFKFDMEAVVGALAAKRAGMRLGTLFHGSHGLVGSGDHVHENMPYKVVGILEPSGTVLDQLILTSVSSVWRVHEEHEHEGDEDHEVVYISDSASSEAFAQAQRQQMLGGHEHGHKHNHDDDHDPNDGHDHSQCGHNHGPSGFVDSLPALSPEGKEVTAFLVKYAKDKEGQTSGMAMSLVPKLIEDNSEKLGYAVPAFQLQKLMENMGAGSYLLSMLTWLILLVSAFSVFISLYQSLKERRYEIAQMRVMGASRGMIFSMIILEGLLIAFAGYLLGLFIAHLGMSFLASYIFQNYQYELSGLVFLTEELWLLGLVLGIGLAASALPAWQAYRTDLSRTLAGN